MTEEDLTVIDSDKRKLSAPLIEYPFPLRKGQLAYFKLPCDLTTKEVDWINQFLQTLVIID